MGKWLPAVQARSSIARAKFPLVAICTRAHPFMRDKETVPADCARPQTQHRRPSAMHEPSVFLLGLRAQWRDAGRMSSESEETELSSGGETGSVRRRLCQRGPGEERGQLKSLLIHTHTDRFMHDTCRYMQIHAFVPLSSSACAMRSHATPSSSVVMMLKPAVAGLRFVRLPFRFTPLCRCSVTLQLKFWDLQDVRVYVSICMYNVCISVYMTVCVTCPYDEGSLGRAGWSAPSRCTTSTARYH